MKDGWIYVKDIEAVEVLENFGIDPGEAQAISLAQSLDVLSCLTGRMPEMQLKHLD